MFSNEQVEDSEILGDLIYTVLKELFTSIDRALTERRLFLPKRARRRNHTKVVVVKTMAKMEPRMKEHNFKNKCRTLNRALQKTAEEFKWSAINIDSVIPAQRELFNEKGHELTDHGFKKAIEFISDDLKGRESLEHRDMERRGHGRPRLGDNQNY